MKANSYRRDIAICLCLCTILISLSRNMFPFCFYLWSYMLNVQTSSSKYVNILSIVLCVFRKLFGKNCPLFGKILSTCLNRCKAFIAYILESKRCSGDKIYIYIYIYIYICIYIYIYVYTIKLFPSLIKCSISYTIERFN